MKIIFITLLLLFNSAVLSAQDPSLKHFHQLKTNPKLHAEFSKLLIHSVRQLYEPSLTEFEVSDAWFNRPLPLFITVKNQKTVRACMGSLQSQNNSLKSELQQKLRLAFLEDIRHPPISADELRNLKVYVTAVGPLVAVKNPESLNPFRDGIYLKAGNKEALYLPGEAKTLSYALQQIRAKAGLSAWERVQIFKFKTESVEVDLQP